NIALILYGYTPYGNSTIFIAADDSILHDDPGNDTYDHQDHRDTEPKALEKFPFSPKFNTGNNNQLPISYVRISGRSDCSRSSRADGGCVRPRCGRRRGTRSPTHCSAGCLGCILYSGEIPAAPGHQTPLPSG